ncbi:hypothetical protein BDW66DRAFT_80733 [Aspergillus desertorum]
MLNLRVLVLAFVSSNSCEAILSYTYPAHSPYARLRALRIMARDFRLLMSTSSLMFQLMWELTIPALLISILSSMLRTQVCYAGAEIGSDGTSHLSFISHSPTSQPAYSSAN